MWELLQQARQSANSRRATNELRILDLIEGLMGQVGVLERVTGDEEEDEAWMVLEDPKGK